MYYPKSQMNKVYNFLFFYVNGLSVESDTNESLNRSHETDN